MIHAYNQVYINDAMKLLAGFFDIGINDLHLEPDELAKLFASSIYAYSIEQGSPTYLSGNSATSLLSKVLGKPVEYTVIPLDRSPEYWAGWVLAYTQWYLNKPFKEILNVISFNNLICMYHPYHEADELKTVDYINNLFPKENKLQAMRKLRKLSQKQLSVLSGVKLRSIQCYEQGEIDINKAEASTLLMLAKTLDCSIEDLLQ